MDLIDLENYLEKQNYRFRSVAGGVAVNLGFLIGNVHVVYDKQRQTLNFNDKARWFSQVLLLALLLYFLIANWAVYSAFQLNVCVAVTVAMVAAFGYKEWRIAKLKAELQQLL